MRLSGLGEMHEVRGLREKETDAYRSIGALSLNPLSKQRDATTAVRVGLRSGLRIRRLTSASRAGAVLPNANL